MCDSALPSYAHRHDIGSGVTAISCQHHLGIIVDIDRIIVTHRSDTSRHRNSVTLKVHHIARVNARHVDHHDGAAE